MYWFMYEIFIKNSTYTCKANILIHYYIIYIHYHIYFINYITYIHQITTQAKLFDKTHPAAPSLAGFTGGAMKPGEFNNLIKKVFGIILTSKELAAIIKEFKYDASGQTIDSKAFLNKFTKMGSDARARDKARILDAKREYAAKLEAEKKRKLLIQSQKNEFKLDDEWDEQDRKSAYAKLTAASAKYDKNAPGSVSLEAFDAKYLSAPTFKEQLKRTFGVQVSMSELSALVAEFDNGHQCVDSQKFLVAFLKLGAEERHKAKLIQLELQRRQDLERKSEHERKMIEAENKMTLKVSYNFSTQERESAFAKLTAASKKYDRTHPGSQSLEGFDVAELQAAPFREMLKRTFGLVLDGYELGAVMSFFDKEGKGAVPCKEFLIYFLKLGQAERHKDHR